MHEPAQHPHIETSRLLLRPWQDSDREPWAAMNADPRVREFFPGLMDRAAADVLLDSLNGHITRHDFGFWAVDERESGAFIGFTGLLHTSFTAPFTPCVEIGWRLAHHAWGKGYATEAARASLVHGFGALGLAEIVSFAVARNMPSRRVMERIGMMRDADGDFIHPKMPADHPLQPCVLYRITASQHAGKKQSNSAEETHS